MSKLTTRKFLATALALFVLPLFAQAALVNINTANVEELKTLNGIGDVKAEAIVSYRTQNGPFQTIEDIQNVSGIGDATYNNIKDFITVGESADTPNNTNTQSHTTNTTPGESTTSSNTTADQQEYWITGNKSTKYEISIGKDRATMVGTPLEFNVETNFGYSKNNIFEWKFGDGSIAYGASATHSYAFPGEYVVVLQAQIPSEVLTTRVKVKVVVPSLAISQANTERIEISNNSVAETDLYGRVLVSNGKTYSFPKDTIILPGQKISFLASVTGLNPQSTYDVYLMTVGENPYQSVNGVTKVEEMRLKQISSLKTELIDLQTKLAFAYQPQPHVVSMSAKVESVTDEEVVEENIEPEDLTASVSAAVELGWFAKLKRFFLRTE